MRLSKCFQTHLICLIPVPLRVLVAGWIPWEADSEAGRVCVKARSGVNTPGGEGRQPEWTGKWSWDAAAPRGSSGARTALQGCTKRDEMPGLSLNPAIIGRWKWTALEGASHQATRLCTGAAVPEH